MKKIVSVFILLGILLTGCFNAPKQETRGDQKLMIYATMIAQRDFAKAIVQEQGEVKLLIPSTANTHLYEPTPKDLAELKKSDVLIYTSDEMEPWIASLKDSLIDSGVKVINASEGILMLESSHDHDHEAEHDHEDHHHEGFDPHVWMDLSKANEMVENIKNGLCEVDPVHASYFRTNAEMLSRELTAMDQDFMTMVQDAPRKTIVFAGHFSLNYFVQRYHLNYVAAYQGSDEPSAKDLASLIDYVKANQIKIIFREEMVEGKIADTIAKETGTEVMVLHSLHSLSKEEEAAGMNYFTIMRQNYYNLKAGLYE